MVKWATTWTTQLFCLSRLIWTLFNQLKKGYLLFLNVWIIFGKWSWEQRLRESSIGSGGVAWRLLLYFSPRTDGRRRGREHWKKSTVSEAFIARDHTPETYNVCVSVWETVCLCIKKIYPFTCQSVSCRDKTNKSCLCDLQSPLFVLNSA